MALRDRLRRAPEPVPAAVPAWPAAAPLEGAGEWSADPGFATVALEERPAEAEGAWTAAAEPIDVTDHTVDMPALAPLPRRRAGRLLRAALTPVLVLGCAGAALAASGALHSKRDPAAPATSTISSSAVATAPKPKPTKRAHRVRHHQRARTHRHHAAVAAPRVAAPAPVQAPAPAPVRHVVSAPAPAPRPAPVATRPAPKPVATKPATTTVSQPAPSAPSGEPGRQPPPAQ